jgi:DNA-binding MarR family transcriptional regulator
MATLRAIPEGEWMEFTRLKAILQATDGNLGSHISTLESAGYIRVSKDFVSKRPRTRVALSRSGRKALALHIEFLRTILEADTPHNSNAGPAS